MKKKLSPETRAKMSAAHLGRKMSEETRAKMSAAHKGKTKSAETRAKMSAAASELRQEQWADPEYRAKQRQAQIEAHNTPEMLAQAAEAGALASHPKRGS